VVFVGGCGGLDYADWIRMVERMTLDRIGLDAVQRNNSGVRMNNGGVRIVGGVK